MPIHPFLYQQHLLGEDRKFLEEIHELVHVHKALIARVREAMKRVPQVGDVVRNRCTRQSGPIVRLYSDLLPDAGKRKTAYVVRLPDKEVLWREDEVELSVPALS